MAGNNENILVEFDYNNISIIDPNKVIDSNGNVKQRYIKQEDLVMYANLECKVLPRTKLAIGGSLDDSSRTIRLATINFLNPGNKGFLDNSYTDEITGKNTLRGDGINQRIKKAVRNPNKSDDYYLIQQTKSNGKFGTVDNGMLGITNISIKQNTSFLTQITVQLEDIKGRTLFESGDESPYAAFFNLPYPIFYLTIKGYVGKAIRIALMLTKFNGRYDTQSGNFKIQLDFMTYKYTILSEISMGALMATPHMYQSRLQIPRTSGGPAQNTQVEDTIVEKGFEKIKELYSEYKEKGLIPDEFPELTLVELKDRIEVFLKTVLENFTKQNLDPLSKLNEYKTALEDYRGEVFLFRPSSWFEQNMDQQNFFVIDKNNQKYRIYTFKQELKDKKQELITNLKSIIDKYNKILSENTTLGFNGSYTVGGVSGETPKPSKIPFQIDLNTFYVDVDVSSLDLNSTFSQRKNLTKPKNEELQDLAASLEVAKVFSNTRLVLKNGELVQEIPYFIFEGPGSFMDETDKIFKGLQKYKEQIETDLTEALANILKSPTNGLGFTPTIRNILAVIFANGEAFLRLMDDVHTAADKLQNDSRRRRVILDPEVLNLSSNVKEGPVTDQTPIYPWPQFINITSANGKEKYEIKYPGDDSLKDKTQAYNFDVWPEVEFVEEFIKGYVQRESPPSNPTPIQNLATEPSRVTYNSIEFPVKNTIYTNKEQTKFFFEIYERALLNTYYSRLSRCVLDNSFTSLVSVAVGECESENITLGLGSDSPFLLQTLKNYGIDATNILQLLENFSNGGLGESWYNYQFGIFNTKYIRNLVENAQAQFLDISLFDRTESKTNISLKNEKNVKDFVISTASNNLDVTDTFPFTNLTWSKTNLQDGSGINSVVDNMDTKGVITYNDTFKIITNFESVRDQNTNKPFTNFLTINQTEPQPSNENINTFYQPRIFDYENQLITEGTVFYNNYKGNLTDTQTTSIFNTPYFVNAIQLGVDKFFSGSPYPYVAAAYLFLNSLPLITLKEKLKSYVGNGVEKKSYLFASLKKFGAVHKLPYAWILKYGSIWHRYKSYIEGGATSSSDILDPVWKNFDYVKNFDPVTNDISKKYSLVVDGNPISIYLQTGQTFSSPTIPPTTSTLTSMNIGFYPKTINDFSVFYVGTDIIKTDSQIIGIGGIQGNLLTITQINGTLFVGDEIFGNNILPGTVITNVISNTEFEVSPSQQSITDFFYVTNASNPGYTDTDIQNAFQSGLTLSYNENIYLAPGSDPNNLERSFLITPWTTYLKVDNNKFAYLLPSQGSLVNQFQYECFGMNNQLRDEITGNTSVFNGSVRTYWSAPNYGYFENDSLVKPSPFEYMKYVNGDEVNIENYSINGNSNFYSEIDELLSVFDKNTLDIFEQQFLNFSRSIYDFEDENVNSGTLSSISNLKNFQSLMRQIMKVPLQEGSSASITIENLQTEQFVKLNKTLTDFLNYDTIVKLGNPASFDRRLFFTFSNLQFENPYKWREYTVFTPSALPTLNGNVSLATSQNIYPQQWRTLYVYVGFSTIEELKYKDSGSFITDFFIDFNIEFSVENIKLFAPIIKIYATQKLNKFQENSLPPPPPPPTSQETLLGTYTLSNSDTLRIYQNFNQKIANITIPSGLIPFTSLPYDYLTPNDEIVNQVLSLIYNPIPTISSSAEIILPEFEPEPSPIIPNGREALETSITSFLQQSESYLDTIINNVFNTLRNNLKNVPEIVPEGRNISNLEGPQTKDELWETFKAINDKWIAGSDLSTKTLFEDVLILDRANRNIGDKFLIDIFALKNRLANIPEKTTMLLFIRSILLENHFQVLTIPGYVNFYNVQEVVKDAVPRPEGTLEIGNTLFGVFNSVDYTNSSTKMVCVYAGKPSEHLAVKNVDYRFRNDAFEMSRISDNPLIEDQIDKKDWDKSNKVVGFNVDIGPQNQSIIKSFQVSQNGGLSTMESLKVINQMANQAGNRANSTQSVSLYNLYKNRSYTCNLSMMGNAMIQPTMYFNLRYVPMFTGPYLITEVNHTISIGDFSTDVVGVRQPTASLPTVDNFLQSLKQNLLKKIIERQRQAKAGVQVDSEGNVIDQKNEVLNTIDGTLTESPNQDCKPTIARYETYATITPSKVKRTFSFVKREIEIQVLAKGINDIKLNYVIFIAMYLGSGYKDGFEAFENNYSGILLTDDWYTIGNATFGRRPQYFCLKNDKNQENPYAVFANLTDHIVLLIELWKNKISTYGGDNTSLTKFLILNKGYYKSRDISVYDTMTQEDKNSYETKVAEAANIFNAS